MYAISCFKLPAGLCVEICSMAYQFWWGQRGRERRVHWINKDKPVREKMEGGMGFRDLQLFNKALLARQCWRLLQYPNSLVFRLLKAKYFPNSSFLNAPITGNVSYIWRSICDSRQILKSGLRWRVGTGSQIKVWHDAWLPSPSTFKVVSPIRFIDEDATVDSLIDPELMSWDIAKLRLVFLPKDVEIIQQIPLSRRRG
jgi:hypothetical protein